jgi:hypothetical protein
MRFIGWLSLSVGFALALGFPMVLLGFPLEAVWPVALACGAVLLIVRRGGTIEASMNSLFAYGLVFSVWCVAGLAVCVPLALAFSGFRAPMPLYVIFAFGLFGVVREVDKSQHRASVAEPKQDLGPSAVSPTSTPSAPTSVAQSPTSVEPPAPRAATFDNTRQRMEARKRVRRDLGE